jgi:hypothetical protein
MTDTTELREIAKGLDAYERSVSDSLEYGNVLRSAADELDRLRAIEASLPHTADGVAIVPGMKLYTVGTNGKVREDTAYAYQVGTWVAGFYYSTEAAALAAGGKGEG